MSIPTTYYGWEDGGKWYLSVFPRGQNRGKNVYDTKKDAIIAAKTRTDNLVPKIVWEV
jgi:hypothetical protein